MQDNIPTDESKTWIDWDLVLNTIVESTLGKMWEEQEGLKKIVTMNIL